MENLTGLAAQPMAALIIGIVILLFPRVLNYAIAAYLIFIGVTGLWPDWIAQLGSQVGGAGG